MSTTSETVIRIDVKSGSMGEAGRRWCAERGCLPPPDRSPAGRRSLRRARRLERLRIRDGGHESRARTGGHRPTSASPPNAVRPPLPCVRVGERGTRAPAFVSCSSPTQAARRTGATWACFSDPLSLLDDRHALTMTCWKPEDNCQPASHRWRCPGSSRDVRVAADPQTTLLPASAARLPPGSVSGSG